MPHIQSILNILKSRQLLLVTAESLTGGLIATHITDVPGASAVFWGGFVTYSIEAKQQLLSIPKDTIERFGVVSIETAKAMAEGALSIASAASGSRCYALAVTGLAGPSGGSKELPVGTVCIACAGNETERSVYCERFVFCGARDAIRKQTYTHAMHILAQELESVSHGSSMENPCVFPC